MNHGTLNLVLRLARKMIHQSNVSISGPNNRFELPQHSGGPQYHLILTHPTTKIGRPRKIYHTV